MNVIINGITLLSPITGIGRYTKSLSEELQKIPGLNVNVFYGKELSQNVRQAPVRNIHAAKKIIRKFIPKGYYVSRYLMNCGFQKVTKGVENGLYHEPNFIPFPYKGKKVITVHDLSVIRHPETHPADRVHIFKRYFERSVLEADAIITNSDYTTSELVQLYPSEAGKIFPIHLGVDSTFKRQPRPLTRGILKKYGLTGKKYILSVCTLEPRKNLQLLFKAYLQLPENLRNEYSLVIAGLKGWKEGIIIKEMDTLIKQDRLVALGYVADEDLPALYTAADVFVYPSIYEGFGFPVLEAMACGTPVLVSNSSSLPEVAGKAGTLADPYSVADFTEKLVSLLTDKNKKEKKSEEGIKQAAQFSWKKCAERTYNVYAKLMPV